MALIYRADTVGSLLRPREVLDARSDIRTTAEQLRAIEDQHILQALQRQKDLGFRIFTDGELRRKGFMSDFYESVEGLDDDGSIARSWKASTGGSGSAAVSSPLTGLVVERIRQMKRLTKHEVDFLMRHSPGDVKMTLPSANQFPAIAYRKGLSDRAYPTYADFLWDVVPIIKSEVQALVREGVKYIQIDAPRYSYYLDPKWREFIRTEMGVTPEHALDEAIRVDNACLEGARRDGVVVAIHLCRGNNRSQWYAEGGYDPIAEKLFNELDRRPLPARVRIRSRRHVRAATLRAERQRRRSRSGQQQAPGAGIPGSSAPTHRRGQPLRADREPRAQPAVRLRLRAGGESADRGRAVAQAAARRRHGTRRLARR